YFLHRTLLVDAPDRGANRRRERRRRFARRLDEERQRCRRILGERHVDVRLRVRLLRTLFDTSDDADDLTYGQWRPARIVSANHEARADSRTALQVPFGEHFVDDANRRTAGAIVMREFTAG